MSNTLLAFFVIIAESQETDSAIFVTDSAVL